MQNNLLKKVVPPVLTQAYRGLMAKRLGHGVYTGPYEHWDKALEHAQGYESKTILDFSLEAIAKAKTAGVGFERDGIYIERNDYAYPMIAYLAKKALHNDGQLNIIDFGGGLGSSYFQCKQFFGSSIHFNWQVVEQKHFVEKGRSLALCDQLSFVESLESCTREANDLLLISGVLQYLEKPFEILKQARELKFKSLLIDRTPVIDGSKHKLMIQHVPKSLYQASYPSWLFSKECFLQEITKIGDLSDSFSAIDGRIQTLSLDIQFEGYMVDIV